MAEWKMGCRAHALVFASVFLLALLPHPAFSQELAMGFSALGDSNGTFYTLELRYYKFIVVNTSQNELRNVKVLLRAPLEFAFVVDGSQRPERSYEFVAIRPGQALERTFELKALSPTSGQVEIKAFYGTGPQLNNTASVLVQATDSGLALDAKLDGASVVPGRESVIDFTLINRSGQAITNIRAELFSGANAQIPPPPFEVPSLNAGEGVSGKMAFAVPQDIGEGDVVLRVFFDDASGAHALEKAFPIKVEDRGFVVLAIIIVILLLVIIHFYKKYAGKGGDSRPEGKVHKSTGKPDGKFAHGDGGH